MSCLLQIRQLLKGQKGAQNKQTVIIKSVQHFHLENKQDVLKHFQIQSPFFHSLLDEIINPADPPAIVLKHLDNHLLNASASRELAIIEIKYIAKSILEGLKLLHSEGFVHIDNVHVHVLDNYRPGDIHFTDVQLADMRSTIPADSAYAKEGDMIRAPI
ncbi:hypothetical protein EMCG_09310 [[Emmonsia] crescens]|uniref:Protein kinase domain-containing protein n=1 Tax=[Emmonsia] crescens TaxID=73230 RepID=A0A0G2I3J8_9EURO|nr:hypothetical protein EMCG_09310 [Emmonsia crescens UAMH 3008]